MNRLILGAVSALLLAGAGLFWWQGRAAIEASAPPVVPSVVVSGAVDLEPLPDEDGTGLQGEDLPEADPATREERRFNRLDRNRDNLISRTKALQPRVAAFRKFDQDGNNLLSFEEWAIATSSKFRAADGDGNGTLTRLEFVATRPRPARKPACRC